MKILLAEDELDLSRALVAVLKHSGFEVDPVYDGDEAAENAKENTYDLLLFDIMMPKKDGLAALREIRARGDVTPAILLTAKAETEDKVAGLDAGADDYLTKPFDLQELLSRIRSVTRRGKSYEPPVLKLGNVRLDTRDRELTGVNTVKLSAGEAKLMTFLMLRPEKEIPTGEILQRIWNDEEEVTEEIVWVYVSYLRDKLYAVKADLAIRGEKGKTFALVKADPALEEEEQGS